jgi:hypothetical protein
MLLPSGLANTRCSACCLRLRYVGVDVLLPSSCASRGLSGRFAEKVARDIEDRKAPPLFRMRLEVCLDEYLHRFLAGVHFDPERRIAKINLVATTILSSDNRMRHDLLPPLM